MDYAKKNPGKVSYASSGTGSSDHLSAVLFRQRTQSTGVDVPYRGGGAAIADLIGGQVNVSFQNLGAVQTHIKAGKLKALAITGDARAADLPDVPTLTEAGIKDMVVYSWQGFAVPKGTPAPIVQQLSKALQTALREPQTEKTLQGLGFEVVAEHAPAIPPRSSRPRCEALEGRDQAGQHPAGIAPRSAGGMRAGIRPDPSRINSIGILPPTCPTT